MEKIGTRELVYKGAFLIPEGEEASFETSVLGWDLEITIAFEDSGEEHAVRIEQTDKGVRLLLINWSSAVGTALAKPSELGSHSSGRELSFMISNYRGKARGQVLNCNIKRSLTTLPWPPVLTEPTENSSDKAVLTSTIARYATRRDAARTRPTRTGRSPHFAAKNRPRF